MLFLRANGQIGFYSIDYALAIADKGTQTFEYY